MKTLLVAAVLYAGVVTLWNLVLMALLDIAKSDVRRLAMKHPSRRPSTLTILQPRDQIIPEQRPGGAS